MNNAAVNSVAINDGGSFVSFVRYDVMDVDKLLMHRNIEKTSMDRNIENTLMYRSNINKEMIR